MLALRPRNPFSQATRLTCHAPATVAMLAAALLVPAAAAAKPLVLDDFNGQPHWKLIASDGVRATLRSVPGRDGNALRLEYDFESGSGFCVIRLERPLDLPENYRLAFDIRGSGPPNNLEFKLVGPANENVWWVNRHAYRLPADWTRLVQKRRQFKFAWGPSDGKPLKRIGAIELAISAAEGGSGFVEIDNLTFEPLEPPQPVRFQPIVEFSSTAEPDAQTIDTLPCTGELDWRSAPDDPQPVIRLDFQQMRDFGGVHIAWDADNYADNYQIDLSPDGRVWEPAATVTGGGGGDDYVPLADAQARGLRIRCTTPPPSGQVAIRSLRILPAEFADSPNASFRTIAHDQRAGLWPRYLLDKQTYWTIVGAPNDTAEALISETGAVEPRRGRYSIEPVLRRDDGTLVTWADADRTATLADNYLPIPSVRWRADGLELTTTTLVAGGPGASMLLVAYRLTNTADRPSRGALLVAIRPFQVLPPWQSLNIVGGVGRIETIRYAGDTVHVDGQPLRLWVTPDAFGASGSPQAEISEAIARGHLPDASAVTSPAGLASAAMRYDYDLPPAGSRIVVVEIPLHVGATAPADGTLPPAQRFGRVRAAVARFWRGQLDRVQIELPPSARRLVDTFRTAQAYILINADGPAIQPGSRTYERSWIRDGALTSTALLYSGHPERVRAYIEWYSQYLSAAGKVPCIVDRRGPDPIPENDSTGEYIYLIAQYVRFTGDRELLERVFPKIIKAVDYLNALRAQRKTDVYKHGTPEQRACYGLVPESISHEGYSPARHSYWDDFLTVLGYKEAAWLAGVMNRPELQKDWQSDLADARACLYGSMKLAMANHHIDYIPGCVELGDFDATSTAIGVFPCGELGHIPQPALDNTFERYRRYFEQRRDGTIEWNDYTPYELRIVGALLRMGKPAQAHALVDFFMRHQRPAGWNHWAEVVHRDRDEPKYIGDMPDTWVGSGFMNSLRSLLVYERDADASLVLGAGILAQWLSHGGVKVANLPTAYGPLSFSVAASPDDPAAIIFRASGDLKPPPGGVRLALPLRRAVASATIDGKPAAPDATGEFACPRLPREIVIHLRPQEP